MLCGLADSDRSCGDPCRAIYERESETYVARRRNVGRVNECDPPRDRFPFRERSSGHSGQPRFQPGRFKHSANSSHLVSPRFSSPKERVVRPGATGYKPGNDDLGQGTDVDQMAVAPSVFVLRCADLVAQPQLGRDCKRERSPRTGRGPGRIRRCDHILSRQRPVLRTARS